LRLRTEAKGYRLRQRLPVYPEFVERVCAGAGAGAGALLRDRVMSAHAGLNSGSSGLQKESV
jgi:hypothetical protein